MSQNYIEIQNTYIYKSYTYLFWGKLWILRSLGTDGNYYLHKLGKDLTVSMTSTIWVTYRQKQMHGVAAMIN